MGDKSIGTMESDGFEHVTEPSENFEREVEASEIEESDERTIGGDEEDEEGKKEEQSGVNMKGDSNAVQVDVIKSSSEIHPTWTRMHLRHLSVEVLKDHNIDYIIDDQDPNYVLIRRWVPEYEQDFLWAATRALRTKNNAANFNPPPAPRVYPERVSSPGIIEVRRASRGSEMKLDINRMDIKEWLGVKYMAQRGKHVLDVAVEEGKPVRLAINSDALRDELSIIVGAGLRLQISVERRVFIAPWKVLVEYEGAIRERLKKLEDIKIPGYDMPAEKEMDDDKKSYQLDEETKSDDRNVVNRPYSIPCEVCDIVYPPHDTPLECLDTRIAHLRCLIEFMDCDLKHVFELRKSIQDGTLENIAFADLWHLFNPGDLIVTYHHTHNFISHHQAYRVFHTTGGRPRLSKSDLFEKKRVVSPFNINCFYIGYDSKTIGRIHETLRIQEYHGVRSVKKLLVEIDGKSNVEKMMVRSLRMPESYGYAKRITDLISRGERLRDLGQGKLRYYHGLAKEKSRSASDDDDLRYPRREPPCQSRTTLELRKEREKIESHVIIDNEFKSENKAIGFFDAIEFDSRETAENCIHYGVSNNQYTKDLFPRNCFCSDIVMDHVVDNDRAARYKDDSRLLETSDVDEWEKIDDDILMLLPPTIKAFVLEKKTWMMLQVDDIHEEAPYQVTFKNLVVPEGHENLLKALVGVHCSELNSCVKTRRIASRTILLHGPKSTGKLLTVKVLATHFKRPLYTITGSDISVGTWDIGRELATHFQRAKKWNCIIAISDAESLFPNRKPPRDADYGVAAMLLREMDLFNGIIFITAESKNNIDEQIIKGMNICFERKFWDKEENAKIWHKAIERYASSSTIEMTRFALKKDVYKDLLKFIAKEYELGKRWNGVEIDSFFDTVEALATYEKGSLNQGERCVISVRHLDIAAKAAGSSVVSAI